MDFVIECKFLIQMVFVAPHSLRINVWSSCKLQSSTTATFVLQAFQPLLTQNICFYNKYIVNKNDDILWLWKSTYKKANSAFALTCSLCTLGNCEWSLRVYRCYLLDMNIFIVIREWWKIWNGMKIALNMSYMNTYEIKYT